MGKLYAVAGSKMFIGLKVAPKGTVALADFTDMTWTEVAGWTQAGSLGDTQQLVSQSVISEGRDRQSKGTRVGGQMENTFLPLPNDDGQKKFREAIDSCSPYAFKIEWGAGCTEENEVTITVAEPAVITWAGGHGLEVGSPVVFSNDGGALPTGLTAGTTYYVKTVMSPTTFTVSATPGGAEIETTAAGSGTNMAAAQPVGQTDLFYGLALPGAKSGGDANAAQLRNWSIAIDSNIVEV